MSNTAGVPLATFEAVLERITYANEETGYTIAFAMDSKSVQMQVVPAHCDLDDGMHLGNGRVAGHQEAAPDHGATIAQHYLELIRLDFGLPPIVAHVRLPPCSQLAPRLEEASMKGTEVRKETKNILCRPLSHCEHG